MSQTPQDVKPEERLSIRANQAQKRTLRRAADLRHMNVSQFVLQTSLQAAEQLIQQESTLYVSSEDYDWLAKIMDEAPQDLPRLREALAQKPVWDA
jgi:uncharacterized protein (DUF1778 family)